jgi:hypothetical protein
MEIVKSIKDLEKELKVEKKKYDKLCKQVKKCKSSYQYEMMIEDIEDCRQDIIELQLMIQDLRRKEKKEKEMNEIYAE